VLLSIARIKRIKHDHTYHDSPNRPMDTWLRYFTPGVCLVFGSLHCTAWNCSFSSNTEQMLWRIGNDATAVLQVVTNALVVFSRVLERSVKTKCHSAVWEMVGLFCLMSGMLVYAVFRLCIVAIAFSCLRRAPANLYLSTWA